MAWAGGAAKRRFRPVPRLPPGNDEDPQGTPKRTLGVHDL